jgi:hypothetical protein
MVNCEWTTDGWWLKDGLIDGGWIDGGWMADKCYMNGGWMIDGLWVNCLYITHTHHINQSLMSDIY